MGQVPYNTGKVKIGQHYTPPKRPHELNNDELLVQRALLNKGRRRLSDGSIAAIGIAIAVVIAAAVVH